MAISAWPYRVRVPMDPDARLDYRINWADWLATGEAIVSSTWEVTGATVVTATHTATAATLWLTAPSGDEITAVNTITTDSAPVARIDQRTLIITVAER